MVLRHGVERQLVPVEVGVEERPVRLQLHLFDGHRGGRREIFADLRYVRYVNVAVFLFRVTSVWLVAELTQWNIDAMC